MLAEQAGSLPLTSTAIGNDFCFCLSVQSLGLPAGAVTNTIKGNNGKWVKSTGKR